MFKFTSAVAPEDQDHIAELVVALGDKDGMTRQKARNILEKIGSPAVPALLDVLANDKDMHRRWEALKALVSIRNPEAAGALVEALLDENSEIRWLAAEGLIALKRDALWPLMHALCDKPNDVWLRHGAHHVLYTLERYHCLDEAMWPIMDSLKSLEPEVTIPLAVYRALEALRVGYLREAG